MDPSIYKKLKEFGDVRSNIALAKYTTFKIGGPAELIVEVKEAVKLARLVNFLSGEGIPYLVMGGGSNLLISDDGFEGVIIRNITQRIELKNNQIDADSGVSFGVLSALALKNNLSGLEWSAGLPGTVGGAVRGNAGAAGGDTGSTVSMVEALVGGEIMQLNPGECKFGYRDSIFKQNGGVVLRAVFDLKKGDVKTSLARVQEILKKRVGYYPPYPSAGSFFKNISVSQWKTSKEDLPKEFINNGKIPAGWINEKTGLKGLRIGGAMVSEQHGNFLINFDKATASDVVNLVEEVKTRVYNKFDINLEEEVHIIN